MFWFIINFFWSNYNSVLGSSWSNSLIHQVWSLMSFKFMWHVVVMFWQGITGWSLSVHQSPYQKLMFHNSWAQPHIFFHTVYIGHLMLVQVLVASTWSNLNQLLFKWCSLWLRTGPKQSQAMKVVKPTTMATKDMLVLCMWNNVKNLWM